MATKLEFVASKTNAKENSQVEKQLNCNQVWSMYQERCYVYLSHFKKNNPNGTATYQLEKKYAERAKRIAAEYARIYLERKGPNVDIMKRGRFYWMGLGAFASKTVAQILAGFLTNVHHTTASLVMDSANAVHIFAKGNMWLFMDIAPWHYAWAASPETFKNCSKQRNSEHYEAKVKSAFKSLPWASRAIPEVKYFQVTSYVNDAFLKYLPVIENHSSKIYNNNKVVMDAQFKHLMSLADQEQRHILQNICWNHPWMIAGAEMSRSDIAPRQFISFDAHYQSSLHKDTEKAMKTHGLKEDPYSYAPDGLIAENVDKRMVWIKEVARKYHALMQDKKSRAYMEGQLLKIALDKGWATAGSIKNGTYPNSNDPDGDGDYVKPK